jgi:peptidylprolyl isomerase
VRRTALILPVLLLAGLLGACSSDDSDLPKVSGQFGATPKITIAKDVKPSKDLEYDVLKEGSGPEVAKGDLLVADYVGEIYKTGKVFDSSYQRGVPAAFPIGAHRVISGWDKSLVGVKAGSRVVMVVPPKDGYGKQGNQQAGIKGTDSLVFVVDVIASYPKKGAPAPKSTPVSDLPGDLPQVSGDPAKEPSITVPAGTTPPKEPKATVLAKGTGPKAGKGKLAIVEYKAVSWSGKPLASSWGKGPNGGPVGVPILTGQPNPFDLLDGIPAGSRVLLTLPATTGADASQESVAVVVDLLGLHGPAKDAKGTKQ